MPLADLRGHIAVLAKDGRPKRALVRIICAARILTLHTHGLDAVLVMTGQHRRARRHTPRTDVCLLKPHTRSSQRVDVRRLHKIKRLIIAANRARGLVVCVDKQNVRPLRRQQRQRQQAGKDCDDSFHSISSLDYSFSDRHPGALGLSIRSPHPCRPAPSSTSPAWSATA